MRIATLGICFIFAVVGVASAQQATVTISGRVTVAAAGALPGDMIVYLEPADPSAHFDPPAQTAEISQKGAKFTPPLLVISAGQAVLFKNDEEQKTIEHNVFSRSPALPFDLGLFKPPEVKRVAFPKPGVVRLYCSIHKLMDGIVYVCPTPFFAKVNQNGTYQINNVPQGQWRLKTWQRNPKYDEQDMAVTTTGATMSVDLQLSRK